MGRQYKRVCQLVLGGNGGTLDVSKLRVAFRVTHAELSQPQSAVIVVYNLSNSTEKKIIQKEYDKVILLAGYEDTGPQKIFSGEIVQARLIRESPTDTCVILIAKDSAKAFEFGVISQTLPAGHTYKDQVEACVRAWKPFGISIGHIGDLGSKKMPKCRVLHGMITDQMRRIVEAPNAAWHIRDDGKLYVYKNTGFLPNAPFVLNSETGLIGRPEQTFDGITGRCLLNPQIRPGTRVKIDERSINQGAYSTVYLQESQNALYPSLAADGVYKVLFVDEQGDTHGIPWYTEFVCISASGGIIPLSVGNRLLPLPD